MSRDKKMSVELLHKINKKLILNLIKTEGKISRSEVSNRTDLTPPTVAKIIDELVCKDKLVEYNGVGDSNGGRPPVVVSYNSDKNFIIGIDLGATFIRGCLLDLDANFISEVQIPTELDKGIDDIVDRLHNMILKFIDRCKESNKKIWGIGIGVAGLVNRQTKKIDVSPVFGWKDVDLKEMLALKIDLPIFIENSTRLMALGELNFGEHNGSSNFAVVNVGYGIAAGLVVEGRLVKGESGYAGEFGHITVDTVKNVICSCGKVGCLEAMASGMRIEYLGKKGYNTPKGEYLRTITGNNPSLINAKLIANASKNGDKFSLEIYDEVIEYLAQAIGSLANLLNFNVIYIGGGVSLNGDFYFEMLNKKVEKYLLYPNRNVKILPSTFGEHSTSIGAASMVLEQILDLEL